MNEILLDAGPGDWLDDDPSLREANPFPAVGDNGSVEVVQGPAGGAWPSPPLDDAYHGLAGDVVRAIEPHSESDPVALLVPTLVMFGSLVGRGPHVRVEADEHPGRLYTAIVGDSSRGRKGTANSHIRRLFAQVDESFPSRVEGGLSSGEGLIDRVRDPDPDDGGEVTAPDKRLLVLETELASAFKVMDRQGNTLSPVLRNAWDGTPLGTLTRNARLKATGTHVSVVGHITIEEVRRLLNATEAANGFGNRFIWICVRRSKLLPNGGTPNQLELNELSTRLLKAAEHARRAGVVTRTEAATELWANIYADLSSGGQGGLSGALTTRAEAQVTRLSLLYALLDEADAIDEQHLRAALALWDYSARSVVHVFGDSTGNSDADAILRALRATAYGLTRTEIRDLFGRNIPAAKLDQALTELLERERAHFEKESSGGRPTERWHHGKQP